jgi:hypothetical protein
VHRSCHAPSNVSFGIGEAQLRDGRPKSRARALNASHRTNRAAVLPSTSSQFGWANWAFRPASASPPLDSGK